MLSRKKTLRDSASGVADNLRPHVEEARRKAGPAIADARAKAGPALADARAKAEPALRDAAERARAEGGRAARDAREAASPYLAEARKQVEPAVAEARKRVTPVLDEARSKAAPVIEEARAKAAPVIEEARAKAGPVAEQARRRAEDLYDERVLPTVATAVTLADDATSELRQEAGRRGSAAVAALKGEVEPPRETHRVRNVLVALGLAGAAGFVAKKLGDRQAAAAWESAYTTNPPRPASPADSAAPAGGRHAADSADDIGGGSPGEAVADDAERPHAASTPDAPADVVDVEDREGGAPA